MRATDQLMRAAVDQGWPIIDIAHSMKLNRHDATRRVTRARRLAENDSGYLDPALFR